MSTTVLAEIREAEAPPAIAAIYAALHEGIGIAQVNLIWRHAAALPGVLDWLWAQAAPALASGAAAAARDHITAGDLAALPGYGARCAAAAGPARPNIARTAAFAAPGGTAADTTGANQYPDRNAYAFRCRCGAKPLFTSGVMA